MDYFYLIEKILSPEQRLNILDVTKCSVTAANLYNFLTGRPEIMYNNNLANIESNFGSFADTITQNVDSNVLYFMHFSHIVGETSHYWIVCQLKDQIIILQSAVFEFSIQDWLFPEIPLSVPDQEQEVFDPVDRMRLQMKKEYDAKEFKLRTKIIENIQNCKWSSGRQYHYKVFLDEYVTSLNAFQNVQWTLQNYETLCQTYQSVFSCELKRAIILGQIRNGNADIFGQIKFVQAPMQS